uniref:ABC transmembrane type-1 domain-containing protein n=1 Tax=Anopheles coluzzii TaxID=1518534 RepID=A0A8W7PYA8_ANOCL
LADGQPCRVRHTNDSGASRLARVAMRYGLPLSREPSTVCRRLAMALDPYRRTRRRLLLAPTTLTLLLFMVLPMLLMGWMSLLAPDTYGGVRWKEWSLDAYVQFLYERDLDDSLTLNSDYLQIFGRSFLLAGFATVVTLLIGFPTALYIALKEEKTRQRLILLISIPFWTNLLVRTYAWMLLLRNGGLIDSSLSALGLSQGALDVLYTPTAVAIGFVYSFLPFMVLPIYTSLEKMDWRLVEAAFDLGANPLAGPQTDASSVRRENDMQASNTLWRFRGVTPTAILAFVYLYLPIVVLVVLSFNANRIATLWTGFSFDWYLKVMDNDNILRATKNSLIIACGATVLATSFATMAALAMAGRRFRGQAFINAMLGLPLLVPEIVTAVASLLFFLALGLDLGLMTVLIAHTVFCIPLCLPAHPRPAGRAG